MKGVVAILRLPCPAEISFSATISARDLKFAPISSLWTSLGIVLSNLQNMYSKCVYRSVVYIRKVPKPPEISFSALIRARDLKAPTISLWP